jgi:hypothetical protein
MRYEIDVPPSLKNQFVQAQIGGKGADGTSQAAPKQIGKANWVWIISNTSLVVPVLLAAAILYIASTKLNDWTGSERKAFERLIDSQAQAISEDRQRFKLLFDELQKKPEPSPTPQPVQAPRSPQRRSRSNRR